MKNAFTVYSSDDKPEYLSTEKWKELLAKKQGPDLDPDTEYKKRNERFRKSWEAAVDRAMKEIEEMRDTHMKKTYYVKDIIQSTQVSSIENDGPYYETVLDVEIEYEGKYHKQRDIIRRRFNKAGWDELVEKRYFTIDTSNDEEFFPEELENAKLLIGELYCDCNNEELQRLILYSAALIKTRKKYESDIADLREEYGVDRIKEKYSANKEVK